MKVLILLVLLGATLCSKSIFTKTNSFQVDRNFLEHHSKTATFEIYNYEEHPFKGWDDSKIKGLLGLSHLSLKDTRESYTTYDSTSTSDLPENFDSRQQWPDCIHPIRDQGHCGSCWAHAASEVLSDRFCIASKGSVNTVLSVQDMVSCDWFDHGCNGGILTTSWLYLRFFGIVTDDCKPYSSGDGKVAWCPLLTKSCANSNVKYQKYYAKNSYSLSNIEEIKRNIYENGPVETGFSVYDDFLNYKSGIYKKSSNNFLGGHAVKIIGWGKENDSEYWIVANSWNTTWGENGHFRIAFGECGIENCIAGDPSL